MTFSNKYGVICRHTYIKKDFTMAVAFCGCTQFSESAEHKQKIAFKARDRKCRILKRKNIFCMVISMKKQRIRVLSLSLAGLVTLASTGCDLVLREENMASDNLDETKPAYSQGLKYIPLYTDTTRSTISALVRIPNSYFPRPTRGKT